MPERYERRSRSASQRGRFLALKLVLLIFLSASAPMAWGQYYAAPGGQGKAPCAAPDDPCSLTAAVEAATGVPGSTVFIRLSDTVDPSASFTAAETEDLTGSVALDAPLTLDTYLDATQQGGIAGAVVRLEGDVQLLNNAVITLGGLDLHLAGAADLTMQANTAILGPGTLVFAGTGNQRLMLDGALDAAEYAIIEKMRLRKESEASVTIDENSTTTLVLSDSLTLQRGTFVTNGLLDANGTATVILHFSAPNRGFMDAGTAPRAYLSDDPEDIPFKVKYTGNLDRITQDELPGAVNAVQMPLSMPGLPVLEIAMDTPFADVTLTNDFAITQALILTQGRFKMLNSYLDLGNGTRIVIGEGVIQDVAAPIRGGLRFPTIQETGTMGVDLLAGLDGIDLHYIGSEDRNVGPEWPTDQPFAIRNVTIDPADPSPPRVQVALRPDETFRATNTIHIKRGILALESALMVTAFDNTTLQMDLPDGALSTTRTTGSIRVEGSGQARLLLNTGANASSQTVDLSAFDLEVALQGEAGRLTLDAIGAGLAELKLRRLSMRDGGGVAVGAGLALFDVETTFVQQAGRFELSGTPVDATLPMQQMRIGDSLLVEAGHFKTNGASLFVEDAFTLGSATSMAFFDAAQDEQGRQDRTLLNVGGTLTVMPDRNPDSNDPADRNRFYLAGGTLTVAGNYDFQGTGDFWDEALFAAGEYGLDGEVIFWGSASQRLKHRAAPEAAFNTVRLNGAGPVILESDLRINEKGRLYLQDGLLETGPFEVVLHNRTAEGPMSGRTGARNIPPPDVGGVEVASRDQYVDGRVRRFMKHVPAAPPYSGFYFPLGDVEADRQVFAPLILQFPGPLDAVTQATVSYETTPFSEGRDRFDFDPFRVPGIAGDTLLLDVLAPFYWRLEINRIPVPRPNIRIANTFLANVFEIEKIRLVQFDCDGANPRLAGVFTYDDEREPFGIITNFVNGIPNLTQEEIALQECQLLAVASDGSINPIHIGSEPGLVQWQYFHNAAGVGPVDYYIDDVQFISNQAYQSPSASFVFPGGPHKFDFVETTVPDNASPLLSTEIAVVRARYHLALFNGRPDSLYLQPIELDRPGSVTPGELAFVIVHGGLDAPPLTINLIDDTHAHDLVRALTTGLDAGEATNVLGLPEGVHLLEVRDAVFGTVLDVFRFDLTDVEATSFILLASGLLADGSFKLIGFDESGEVLTADVVTATTVDYLPVSFTLHGNHPNPFHPSTTIRFDLPESAQVSVDVVDVLGRAVLTLPSQRKEPGVNHTIELDASGLASGLYFYRVVARSTTGTHSQTGRMMLIR